MAVGRESLVAAGLGLARLKLWSALSFFLGGRCAVFYSITARRSTHPEEFKSDMAALFKLLREGAIHPIVIDRLPLAAAESEVHARIDGGGRRRQNCAAALVRLVCAFGEMSNLQALRGPFEAGIGGAEKRSGRSRLRREGNRRRRWQVAP